MKFTTPVIQRVPEETYADGAINGVLVVRSRGRPVCESTCKRYTYSDYYGCYFCACSCGANPDYRGEAPTRNKK